MQGVWEVSHHEFHRDTGFEYYHMFGGFNLQVKHSYYAHEETVNQWCWPLHEE